MAEPLVEIKVEEHKMKAIQRMLADVPKAMPKVVSRAINKTASSSKTKTAREITSKVRIKVSAVKKGITVHKATYTRWLAMLDLLTRRIPLIEFAARRLKTGVSYQISRTEGRKKITDAPRPFIQTMRSGHTGVFRRKTAETRRLPIRQLMGPSIGGVFEGASGIAARVQRESAVDLEKNLDSQVKYLLSRARPT